MSKIEFPILIYSPTELQICCGRVGHNFLALEDNFEDKGRRVSNEVGDAAQTERLLLATVHIHV